MSNILSLTGIFVFLACLSIASGDTASRVFVAGMWMFFACMERLVSGGRGA